MTQLIGTDGRPLVSTRPQPETRQIAVASVRDRWSSYPSAGLTPERLTAILREADAGDLTRWAELAEEMEEKDTHLLSIMQTRKLGVLGTEWEIQPFASDNPEDVRIAQFVKWALDQVRDWEGSMLDVLDAIGKGLSISELNWVYQDGAAVVDKIDWVHLKRFRFDERDQLRVTTDDDPVGIELPPNKFLLYRYKARSGHAARAGLHRTISWMYLFKNWDIKDWVSFAETYGQPLRLGRYDQNATEADKAALYKALINIASDAAGIIPKNTSIEFITDALRTAGGDVFKALANFCNAEMSKAVLGQTLTTEVGDKGSYAASKTHGEVRQDLKEADCRSVAEVIRQQLIRPLVYFNFGSRATRRLPWMKFHYEPPEDLKAAADTYKVLLRDIGLPMSQEHLYEKFGVPKPAAGQVLVSPPSPGGQALPFTSRLALSSRTASANRPEVEQLAMQAREQAERIMGQLADQVRELIRNSSSLEEVRDRIAEMYRQLDTRELETLISRATMAADLYGRWTVHWDG